MAIITDPDWIDPEETTFDVEKPIRSEQGIMLAGNPIAIAMGKPGAPRARAYAMATAADLPLTVTAANTYSAFLGHGIAAGADVAGSGSYVTGYTLTVTSLTGTVRYRASHRSTAGGGGAEMRVLKNGVELARWVTSSSAFVERTIDISVIPGDVIVYQHRAGSGTSNFALGNVTASNGYFQRIAIGVEVP